MCSNNALERTVVSGGHTEGAVGVSARAGAEALLRAAVREDR
jgi:hypothetical protein